MNTDLNPSLSTGTICDHSELLDLLSEAAVEIENLTDKDNPVARRLRAKIRELESAA